MASETHSNPAEAIATLERLYAAESGRLRDQFTAFAGGADLQDRARGYYPFLRVDIGAARLSDVTRSYGFCDTPGIYETTITRPDMFRGYLVEQLTELGKNHGCKFEVGLSEICMPIHFAFPNGLPVKPGLASEKINQFAQLFDAPNLAEMDDELVNGEAVALSPSARRPLSLFTAPRIDYSLHRLQHYTGTDCGHFQNFVLFTNYQFYVDGFRQMAERLLADPSNDFVGFVEPAPSSHAPQMPAYHLKRDDLNGITLINIGVGPSNAKTMTDHVAVLRPSAWIMLGHCAGLRRTQRLGDYVLAHGYVRDDHVLDADLPLWVPIPALAEVQTSLEQAVADVVQLDPIRLKKVMRTGTVASIDNR
ncbi:MAG: AMP nucleosidase, partial [Hyphomicrobiaceae bacterium]